MIENFKILSNKQMTKIVGGLLLEHVTYDPIQINSEEYSEENFESIYAEEDITIEINNSIN